MNNILNIYIKKTYYKIIMENIPEEKQYITNHSNWHGAVPEKEGLDGGIIDNGKYDNKPLDKDYFKNYMIVRVACPNCSKMIARGDLSKHKKRAICINNAKDTS
jgi:hypothetical protein